MSKEQQSIPIQEIEKAAKRLIKPQLKAGLELPQISVVELSRLTGLPPVTVLNTIADGRIILNGAYPARQAVVSGAIQDIRTPQPGPFYQKTAAGIWSEGQRYQRRFQFQPINTKGKPTRKRIETRVVEEQTKRAKIAFVPYTDPIKISKQERPQKLSLRWAKTAEQVILTPEERFIQTLAKEAKFPTQNATILKQNLERAQREGQPFKFGCFVCLLNEWSIVDGKPVYRVSTDPNRLSRLEQNSFVERSSKIFETLSDTGIPYEWTFLIADTDAEELYGNWVIDRPGNKLAIETFKERVGKSYPNAKTTLWSDIQANYEGSYADNFNKVLKGQTVIPNIIDVMSERYNYYYPFYQTYFSNQGFKVTANVLETLSTVPPKRNIALYAAQGPIIEKEFDCLVIGDRDPLRCGKNQSALAKDLPIWYPYFGG